MPTLYIVATPIGNLADLTPRALETLQKVDLIAAEDTRRTRGLLQHHKLETKLISYHQHNESARAHELVARMQTEKINIALVSDAGTPCISDPGGILVAQAAQNNIEVIAVPGPCAVAAALSICGFPFTTFTFSGFAPRDRKGLEAFCTQIKAAQSDLFVFYESPMRIVKTLQTMSTALPGAHMCACNDLTKRHERA
ncbi:MAG: 16S rRNA (cytidine(1402)-2'-O)-methyltransferase, partial [Clostridia bacterium]|nr:16S rRNA (cytidine(1402)-2'-O)-methyltransferase [Clostridia bacterium]